MKTIVSYQDFKVSFPLSASPLVHCITNEVTCETVANALLYVDAKPIMAADPREFSELFQQTSSLLLNLGHISPESETNILAASQQALTTGKPTVIDLVGVSATMIRFQLAQRLLKNQPTVVKGNTSELRGLCQLENSGRGVDGGAADQTVVALQELTEALQVLAKAYPRITFLATGATDLIVNQDVSVTLSNGVKELDRFTGSGDVVGSLIAALLGTGLTGLEATVMAVSYFNLAGEAAHAQLQANQGLAAFRQLTLDQLSRLMWQENWAEKLKGRYL